MATASLPLEQQRSAVESRIRALVNADLKEICKTYGYQVSGNKAVLQTRCIEVLDTLVKSGNSEKFEEFQYRVRNHGKDPPAARAPLGGPATAPNAMSSGGYRATGAGARPINDRPFKPSPFYDIIESLTRPHELPEMPQNRNTEQATIQLTSSQISTLQSPNTRVMLYCGTRTTPYDSVIDVSFPTQIEVKVNHDDVKANFKGLKNRPGSTKPTDITEKIRKSSAYSNSVQVTYALTSKRYFFQVYLVRYNGSDILTERIRRGKAIPKDQVLQELQRSNDDAELAAMAVRMSLKDPVSTLRISLPVRSTICTHNQCFDGAMFLQLQEQAPQWTCPVCNKIVSFESLCVDRYFEDILRTVNPSTEKVDIEADGTWKAIKEEEELDAPKQASARKPRASYDDDFDDDIIELDDGDNIRPNGIPTPSSISLSTGMTPTPLGPAVSTPISALRDDASNNRSSAGQTSEKRTASAVIDLTLSSDEEDGPPRPAKRQHIGGQASTRPSAIVRNATSTSTSSRGLALPTQNASPVLNRPPSATSFVTNTLRGMASSRNSLPSETGISSSTMYGVQPLWSPSPVPTNKSESGDIVNSMRPPAVGQSRHSDSFANLGSLQTGMAFERYRSPSAQLQNSALSPLLSTMNTQLAQQGASLHKQHALQQQTLQQPQQALQHQQPGLQLQQPSLQQQQQTFQQQRQASQQIPQQLQRPQFPGNGWRSDSSNLTFPGSSP